VMVTFRDLVDPRPSFPELRALPMLARDGIDASVPAFTRLCRSCVLGPGV
jgi:hypothetical protein